MTLGVVVPVLLGVETTDVPSLIPALTPALRPTLTPLVSVGSGSGTTGFGVVDSTDVPVTIGSVVSVLLRVGATDAPSLIPALKPELTSTLKPLVPVGIGSGTTGTVVLDSPVASVGADTGWLEPVALGSAWFATEESETLG